jgi:two-component system chemotaxis response regulator CheB
MSVRVLVVDDSGFFRRRLCEILNEDTGIEVVGTAINGEDAVSKATQLKPDVITMDIEMPVMNGIEAVRRIMASRPTPVLMFSSLTHEGAKATLDALDAGAMDFLPKKFEDVSQDLGTAKNLLRERVLTLAKQRVARAPARGNAPAVPAAATPAAKPAPARAARTGHYEIVAIGTSTGGPAALQAVLKAMPADFPAPVLVIQHMPASFTPAFAQRLDQQCALTVKQAEDGDELRPGHVYLAPGGRQMLIERRGLQGRIRIIDGNADVTYRPSVDITFAAIAKAYPGKALAVVMTGMGCDGREGARLLKQGNSTVWAQNEQSCVIYGMPQAVVEAKLADRIVALSDIGAELAGAV